MEDNAIPDPNTINIRWNIIYDMNNVPGEPGSISLKKKVVNSVTHLIGAADIYNNSKCIFIKGS